MAGKPFTSITIHIHDDGKVTWSAPDADAEGHLWAVNNRPASIAQVQGVAASLGREAEEGVRLRLEQVRERMAATVEREQAVLERVRQAKAALAQFDDQVGEL